MCGPIQGKGAGVLNGMAKGLNVGDNIEIRRLEWERHILGLGVKGTPPPRERKILYEKLSNTGSIRNQVKKGRSCPEGCIAVPRYKSLEELSSGYRRVDVSYSEDTTQKGPYCQTWKDALHDLFV